MGFIESVISGGQGGTQKALKEIGVQLENVIYRREEIDDELRKKIENAKKDERDTVSGFKHALEILKSNYIHAYEDSLTEIEKAIETIENNQGQLDPGTEEKLGFAKQVVGMLEKENKRLEQIHDRAVYELEENNNLERAEEKLWKAISEEEMELENLKERVEEVYGLDLD